MPLWTSQREDIWQGRTEPVARLAISKDFLAEYAKLDKHVQRAVDQAIATFARHPHPGQHLEKPQHGRDDRIRIMPVDGRWRGVVLAPEDTPAGGTPAGETYCLVTVLPQGKAEAYATSHRFSVNRATGVLEVREEKAPGQVAFVSGPQELQLVFAHPFATWRTFLHPNQRQIAFHPRYSGPAQVTGGPGTGKTVTVLHRAAFLAERAEPVLVTSFAGNLADALAAQLDLLIRDSRARQYIEVLNVDRLAYRIVKQARGSPVIADERTLRTRWAEAAADGLTPAFGKNEWEQVILAQDLRTEQAYLTCQRTGRGRPLSKAQRALVWRAAQQVTAELAAASQTTHLQLANEATRLLQQAGAPPYRHILVDEAQDLHPSQWRLLRAAVAPGPDDLFIAADPHQRVYDNRVSLASLQISVRGRSRRLSLNYRTTQEILAWAVPLLGTEPVTGLDGEVDTLLGYRSPMHGPRPQQKVTATRAEEFKHFTERIAGWLAAGLEPHAIGVTARSAQLVREAREALKAAGIPTVSLNGRGSTQAVRAGTMHAMKGLEFQAVAVIGVEQGLVPDPAAVTPEGEDGAAHAQDLQRERCVLFVACTRARDRLYVSGTGEPSPFLPPRESAPPGPLATGAEVSSGQLTIRDRAPADGLAAALYLARAPWRPPVIVPVPGDGVITLPPQVRDAGPLRVLLRAEDPPAVTSWPDWPPRDSYACVAPGIPVGADLEEDALSRFLAGERDLPVLPRRVDRLWRLIHLAADLIAAGAPADLAERCSAVLRHQPGLAITGLLDAGLDSAACVAGLISTGLATARPVLMDDMRAAERLWDLAPAAAAVLCSRLLAGPAYPAEDPAAVVMKAGAGGMRPGPGRPAPRRRRSVRPGRPVRLGCRTDRRRHLGAPPRRAGQSGRRQADVRRPHDPRTGPGRPGRDLSRPLRGASGVRLPLPPRGRADRCPPSRRQGRMAGAPRHVRIPGSGRPHQPAAVTRTAGPSNVPGAVPGPLSPAGHPT